MLAPLFRELPFLLTLAFLSIACWIEAQDLLPLKKEDVGKIIRSTK